MSDQIPQDAIDAIAQHIHTRNNKNYNISVITVPDNPETPQYFEIIPFAEIDNSPTAFYAVDGSTNSQPFYNGLSVGIYRAGYVCFREGKQIRMNDGDDPVILGQSYTPKNILITQEDHKNAIYDELLTLEPIKRFIEFLGDTPENIFSYTKEAVVAGGLSTLLGFCQEILEWSLVYEISCRPETKPYDFILRDGTLRSLNIHQKYLVKLGKFLKEKQLFLVAITKNSPIKMEFNYTFRQIDNYLQEKLKHQYPFKQPDPGQQKLCCWFEVSDAVLANAYGDSGGMFIRKGIRGGRGIGIFHAARLDYVEKLQNYDWVIADLNVFDVIPDIEQNNLKRIDVKFLSRLFRHLTRLTQEHYILGYPYPLVEAHNFVTLSADFKEQIINRVKQSMYESQGMDHVDIENLFVDIHTRF